jgi:hypothetical protein
VIGDPSRLRLIRKSVALARPDQLFPWSSGRKSRGGSGTGHGRSVCLL